MGKKVALVLAIMALLLVAVGLLYWKAGHPQGRGNPREGNAVKPEAASPLHTPESAETLAPPGATGVETSEKKGASPVEPGFTLRPGESLEFAANLTKLNSTVANLKVVVAEKKNFFGKNSWHLQAFAHTENPYRMVFELDDQFDSYSEAVGFSSQQYEMHLNERGQKVDSVQRMLSSQKDPAPADATAARVPPGTRDPLGLMQYLRGVDWSKTPEIKSPVYDGRKFYEVRAVLLSKNEEVKVPAGNYTATKIEIHVYDSGVEMKDAHFLLYLSNNAARIPVLLEAVLPIATARVELTKAS
jgi:Protein of unknown function (DUF3108)